ncbi:MAG: hypothetical protein DMD28_11230 [Gemmatimonadetes bacterium]|nr:MAG: hypothetical protein DMD28_11230 [Gemmatimonadota bacterium]
MGRIQLIKPAALYRHLDSRVSIRRYQRKADQVAATVGYGRLLDWGSFCGQMTFLLLRRGVDAVPFDIEQNRLPRTLNQLLGRPTVYSRDLVRLPFEDASLDAVLSCGTLEHVADPTASLQEIRRILKPEAVCARAHGVRARRNCQYFLGSRRRVSRPCPTQGRSSLSGVRGPPPRGSCQHTPRIARRQACKDASVNGRHKVKQTSIP